MKTPLVVSVPHTGSRTLLKHLGIDQWELHVSDGGLLHFGYDDERIRLLGKPVVHVPIRNPFDTLATWYNRRLPLHRCIARCMSRLSTYRNPNATFYRVEDLDGRVGKSGERLPRAQYQAMLAWAEQASPEVVKFYKHYYG